MDRKKFAKAILRFDYREAECLLCEANINEDRLEFEDIFFHVAYNCDEKDEAALLPGLTPAHPSYPSILGVSLMGFLRYLEERGWSKPMLYERIVFLVGFPLCHLEGAYELALYYYFRWIQEDDGIAYMDMMMVFYDYPGSLLDIETVVYAARKALEMKPDDEVSLGIIKELGSKVGDVDKSETMFAAPFGTADIDNDAINYEEFESRVYKVKYADAAAILSHPDLDEQTRQDWLLSATVWDNDNQHYGGDLSVYGFLMYLLDEGWDKARVYRWLVLTLNASDSIDGAYGLALFYCRKLVAEEETLENLRLLLSFTDVPGDFMGDAEAADVARRILALDANDAKAREVLELVGGTD